MKVKINKAGLVVARYYEDTVNIAGTITVPKAVELDVYKDYAYVSRKFIEVDLTLDCNSKYLVPDLKNQYADEYNDLMKYLKDTDFITSKYNELVTITNEMTNADFIDKYKDLLNKRAFSRKRINELEALLTNLSNV